MTDDYESITTLDAYEDDETSLESEDTVEQLSIAMFEGDTSFLFPEQRQCLHALLKHRYISAEQHPTQWAALMENETLIRGRLHDLFLELEVDRTHQLAFKRAATPEADEPLPSLLRNVAHTKEETIVLMALRQRFFAQRQEGDDVVYVDRATLLDEVADRRPEDATNRAMDQKRADLAIDNLSSAGVLMRTPDPDRFRISGIIEILLPIEKLRALWTWLMDANATDPDQSSETEDDDEVLFNDDGGVA